MKTSLFIIVLLCVALVSSTQLLSDYNAIIHGTFTSSGSDSEGRVVVGGNADLSYYGVGSRLTTDCNRLDLQIGGNFKGHDGQTSRGRTSVGGSIETVQWGSPCGAIENAAPSFNIDTAFTDFSSTSTQIGNQASTGSVTFQYTDIYFSGSAVMNYFSIPSSDLEGLTGMHIDVPAESWTFITVNGNEAAFSNFQIFLSSTTNKQKVLFNFPTTTTLVVSNLSFQGSILAPSASVTYNNGNIEGSIACANYQGTGEFHNYPYIPPETTCICPPCDSYINVPSSQFYSLFIYENIDSDSTDFEGRVAVGGNATFHFVGIGDKLVASSGGRDDLQVSGDLFYHDGEVFNGNIVVEGSYDVERVGTPQGSLLNQAVNIPWHVDFLGLHAISIFLSGWYTNGVSTSMSSTLNLYGEDFYLNTFNINSETLSNARTIVVSVPAESHVIINVNGGNSPVHFENSGIILDGAHSSRILWNFYNTHLLEMNSIQIEGSVLAPVTDVVFNNGQLKGAIFAHSYTGHGEIHLSPWVPLPVPCPPCDC